MAAWRQLTVEERRVADYEHWRRLNETYALQYQGDFTPEKEAEVRAALERDGFRMGPGGEQT